MFEYLNYHYVKSENPNKKVKSLLFLEGNKNNIDIFKEDISIIKQEKPNIVINKLVISVDKDIKQLLREYIHLFINYDIDVIIGIQEYKDIMEEFKRWGLQRGSTILDKEVYLVYKDIN